MRVVSCGELLRISGAGGGNGFVPGRAVLIGSGYGVRSMRGGAVSRGFGCLGVRCVRGRDVFWVRWRLDVRCLLELPGGDIHGRHRCERVLELRGGHLSVREWGGELHGMR